MLPLDAPSEELDAARILNEAHYWETRTPLMGGLERLRATLLGFCHQHSSLFLFYSLYSAGKCTLSPFHFFFRTVSLLLHEPVHHGFISLYSLSLMDYVVAEIQVPSHYQIHLFFLPPKEWEIICVIWETGICISFFYTKNIEATVRTKTTELGKYRFGCLTNQLDSVETKQIHRPK